MNHNTLITRNLRPQRRRFVGLTGAAAAACAAGALLATGGTAGAAPIADQLPIDDLMPTVTIPPTVTLPDFELTPVVPDDLITPPVDECNEYDAAHFSATVSVGAGPEIGIQLIYTDEDVCNYVVGWAFRAPDAGEIRDSAMVELPIIAASTALNGDFLTTIDNTGLCAWEVHVAVEEGLAEVFPGLHEECDDLEDGEPEDGEPEDGEPEDGEPEDGEPEDGEPEDGEPEEDDEPVLTTPAPETPEPAQPEESTPTSQLPQTGSDTTNLLLGGGLVALGLGSAVAIATRRRDSEMPA